MTLRFFVLPVKVMGNGPSQKVSSKCCPMPASILGASLPRRALAGARRIGGCPPGPGVTDKVDDFGKRFYS